MQEEKPPRREREKLRQREEMLAVALNLFSKKGYHNVSMHEVAEKPNLPSERFTNSSRTRSTSTRPS